MAFANRFVCFLFYVGITFCTFLSPPVLAQTVLQFTARTDSVGAKLGMELLEEAYGRLGVSIEMIEMPGLRAITTANNGESDGEVIRLERVLPTYPNLRMVPETLIYIDSVVATKKLNFTIRGWESIRYYIAGTVRGYHSIQKRLKDQKHYVADSTHSSLKMLDQDRVDLVVMNNLDLIRGLNETGLKGIKMMQPPLTHSPLHHMLHKKHEALVPRVNEVLKEMKADGTHQRIIDAFIAKWQTADDD